VYVASSGCAGAVGCCNLCGGIVHQNADISMSGLGVNHSGTVGDCAIAGGCDSAGGVRQQNR